MIRINISKIKNKEELLKISLVNDLNNTGFTTGYIKVSEFPEVITSFGRVSDFEYCIRAVDVSITMPDEQMNG